MTPEEYEKRMEKLDDLKALTGVDLISLQINLLEIAAESEALVKEIKDRVEAKNAKARLLDSTGKTPSGGSAGGAAPLGKAPKAAGR